MVFKVFKISSIPLSSPTSRLFLSSKPHAECYATHHPTLSIPSSQPTPTRSSLSPALK